MYQCLYNCQPFFNTAFSVQPFYISYHLYCLVRCRYVSSQSHAHCPRSSIVYTHVGLSIAFIYLSCVREYFYPAATPHLSRWINCRHTPLFSTPSIIHPSVLIVYVHSLYIQLSFTATHYILYHIFNSFQLYVSVIYFSQISRHSRHIKKHFFISHFVKLSCN